MQSMHTMLAQMIHSPVRNYVTPGLSSFLVGGPNHGKVRVFKADRDTREWVTPHSHRFNFSAWVIEGLVENILFHSQKKTVDTPKKAGNWYSRGRLSLAEGGFGKYELVRSNEPEEFVECSTFYKPGETYHMSVNEVHSIRFSKGTTVVMFEGPEMVDHSVILEPYSDGKVVQTFETRDWMFEREP